ncbi:MAG: VOC family protein, partial [Pseudomonadota bacterium]
MSTPNLAPAIPQLPSGDIEKTAEFFTAQLGFEIIAKMPEHGHLSIRRGQANIHFWQAPTESQAKEIGGQSSCYITTENVESLFNEFKK